MIFKSFFIAGFEGSTGFNLHREWIDQVAATQHDRFADQDYARLKEVGILAARESVRWPLVDLPQGYDFTTLRPILEAGQKHGIEIIYDLFHFGYPQHIDLFSDQFPQRFAEYCFAVASFITDNQPGPYYFTPVNEPSFFSWAAGEVGCFAPHQFNRGNELKVQLIKAAIAGINAIREACKGARIINVDPLCHVVAPFERPDLQGEADAFNASAVFQAWDMLSGRHLPELGGSPEHLDIVGINYYWTNQWEWQGDGAPLGDGDPRRRSLRDLIRPVWQRYGTEMLLTETSHVGDMRPVWMRELTSEVEAILDAGMPLKGVCLYPILGMPEWHKRDEWTLMGLWDLVASKERLERIVHLPLLESLRQSQRLENHKAFAGTPAGANARMSQKFFHAKNY